MNYIVLSPGRTGGTLIVKNLNSLDPNKETAYITHRPKMLDSTDIRFVSSTDIPREPDNNIPVFSKRRCIYNAVLSMAIMGHTSESHHYTNNWDTQSFTLSKHQFIINYLYFLNFYDHIDLSVYDCPPVTVYYEDMIKDPLYLFKQFGIEKSIDYSLCTQSPPRHNMISNLDELKEVCYKQRWAIE